MGIVEGGGGESDVVSSEGVGGEGVSGEGGEVSSRSEEVQIPEKAQVSDMAEPTNLSRMPHYSTQLTLITLGIRHTNCRESIR